MNPIDIGIIVAYLVTIVAVGLAGSALVGDGAGDRSARYLCDLQLK